MQCRNPRPLGVFIERRLCRSQRCACGEAGGSSGADCKTSRPLECYGTPRQVQSASNMSPRMAFSSGADFRHEAWEQINPCGVQPNPPPPQAVDAFLDNPLIQNTGVGGSRGKMSQARSGSLLCECWKAFELHRLSRSPHRCRDLDGRHGARIRNRLFCRDLYRWKVACLAHGATATANGSRRTNRRSWHIGKR